MRNPAFLPSIPETFITSTIVLSLHSVDAADNSTYCFEFLSQEMDIAALCETTCAEGLAHFMERSEVLQCTFVLTPATFRLKGSLYLVLVPVEDVDSSSVFLVSTLDHSPSVCLRVSQVAVQSEAPSDNDSNRKIRPIHWETCLITGRERLQRLKAILQSRSVSIQVLWFCFLCLFFVFFCFVLVLSCLVCTVLCSALWLDARFDVQFFPWNFLLNLYNLRP